MSQPGRCPHCELRELYAARSSQAQSWIYLRRMAWEGETKHLEWLEHHTREAHLFADMSRTHEERAAFHGMKAREYTLKRREYEQYLRTLDAAPLPRDVSELIWASDVGSTHVGGPSTGPREDSVSVQSF